MTATQEVGQKANSVNGQGSISNISPNRFELKRSSGWYDAIDNPIDPLPARTNPRSNCSREEYRDDEYDDVQTFYTVNVESIQDLRAIQDESGCALNVSFAPGEYGVPTIEILDGNGDDSVE